MNRERIRYIAAPGKQICGCPAPKGWVGRPNALFCVREKGHSIEFTESKKLKKKNYTKAHMTIDGRWWPIGKANVEYLEALAPSDEAGGKGAG